MSGTKRLRRGIEVACLTCQKPVYRYPSSTKKFCSIPCRTIAKRAEIYNDEEQTKLCPECNLWKPFSLFGAPRESAGALQAYCNPCASDRFKKYLDEGRRSGVPPRGTTKRGLAMIACSARVDLPTDPQERRNALNREWRLRNKAKVRIWNKLRVHRLRAAGDPPSSDDIQWLLCVQDYRCTYCPTRLFHTFHLDHKTPVSRQGVNSLCNLQLLCPLCNLRKATRTHEEYAVLIGWSPAPRDIGPDVGPYLASMERGDYVAGLAAIEKIAAAELMKGLPK